MPRFLLVAAAALLAVSAAAQTEISVGADVVSRYVWRGFDFGESLSIQPSLELASSGLAVGTWGSYAFTSGGANELDLYVSYTAGPVTVGVTDYYFPTEAPDLGVTGSSDYFNFSDGGDGAHYVEPFVTVAPEGVPVALTVATVAFNDPTFSTYVEAAYGFEVNGTELGLAVGGVFALDSPDGASGAGFYGTSRDATVTQVALSAARELKITDGFALPVFGQYVVNPETERAFLVFGLSL